MRVDLERQRGPRRRLQSLTIDQNVAVACLLADLVALLEREAVEGREIQDDLLVRRFPNGEADLGVCGQPLCGGHRLEAVDLRSQRAALPCQNERDGWLACVGMEQHGA
jgi:hypothetical protein